MSAMKPIRSKTLYNTRKPPTNYSNESLIKVYCRIRPTDLESNCIKILNNETIETYPPDSSMFKKSNVGKSMHYKFTNIFDEFTQQQTIFDEISLDLIKSALNGENALLFSYGVTGSGKTHSMIGSKNDPGIIVRSLDVIFNSINPSLINIKYRLKPDKMNGYLILDDDEVLSEEQRNYGSIKKRAETPKNKHKHDNNSIEIEDRHVKYSFFVSYFEIYNNSVFDLLHQSDNLTYSKTSLKSLREDKFGNMYPGNLIEVECRSTDEAYNVLLSGKKRRHIASTMLNNTSSRSHAIFNIRIVQVPENDYSFEENNLNYIISQFSIVDLAGCERSNRTNNYGDRIQESGSINNSLMTLRSCIEAIRENAYNDYKIIPYRNCKLTHLFKSNFEQSCKIRILVCINPANIEFDETINVFRFAESSREIETIAPIKLPKSCKRVKIDNDDYSNLMVGLKDLISDEDVLNLDEQNYDECDDYKVLFKKRHIRDQKCLHIFKSLTAKFHQFFTDSMEHVVSENGRLKTVLDKMKIESNKYLQNNAQKNQEIKIKYNMKIDKMRNEFERDIFNKKKYLRKSHDKNVHLHKKLENLEKILGDGTNSDYTDYQVNLLKDSQKVKEEEFTTDYSESLVSSVETDLKSIVPKMKIMKTPKVCSSKYNYNSNFLTPAAKPRRKVENYHANTVKSSYVRAPISQSIAKFDSKAKPKVSNYKILKTPNSKHKNFTPAASSVKSKVRKFNKPNVLNLPAMKKRRSRSADLWIDHDDSPTKRMLDFQLVPKMKKSITRSHITVADTKIASKYLLTHEGTDTDGEISRKIITGSIKPTNCGGSTVVFEQMNKITSESPGSKHIRFKGDLQPTEFDGQWTDTEDRCHIAVEGHGI